MKTKKFIYFKILIMSKNNQLSDWSKIRFIKI
jgi:hypothetical protein